VLRRIFGPKRNEVTGEWRKLHKGSPQFALITRYHYVDHIKEYVVGRSCGMHGRGEKIVQGFGGKARRKETTRKTEA
jgi:hypothetical protein